MIYLAAAIDKKKSTIDWFSEMGAKLKPMVSFNPRGAYCGVDLEMSSTFDFSKIVAMNMLAIENSSMVIMKLEEGVMSVGAPIELYYAWKAKKPVYLIYDGVPSIYMLEYATRVFKTDDECVAYVDEHPTNGYHEWHPCSGGTK